MTWLTETPVLLPLIPLAAACLAWLLRRIPKLVRGCCLLALVVDATILVHRPLTLPDHGLPLSWLAGLILFASLVAVLGVAPGKTGDRSLPLLLLWTGLGLGAICGPASTQIAFATTSAAGLALLVWRTSHRGGPPVWPPLILFTLAGLALWAATLAPPDFSVPLRLVASAILLPLFPLHSGMQAVLRLAPGTLPGLLIVVVPVLGLCEAWKTLTEAPEWTRHAVAHLGLLSALAGILAALVQTELRRSLACGAQLYLGLVWWGLALDATRSGATLLFFGGSILVLAGLWITAHHLEARYGALSLRRPAGLARPMPRLAVLLTLLLTAALGLPGFAPFAGLMHLLASPGSRQAWQVAVVLMIWLLASWYWTELGQRLLFGPPRVDRLHRDLGRRESLVLGVIILALTTLSLVTGAGPATGIDLHTIAAADARPWMR